MKKRILISLFLISILIQLGFLFFLKIAYADTLIISNEAAPSNYIELQSDLGSNEGFQTFSTTTNFIFTKLEIAGCKGGLWGSNPTDFYANIYDNSHNFIASSINYYNTADLSTCGTTSSLDFYFNNVSISNTTSSVFSVFINTTSYPPDLSRIDFSATNNDAYIYGCATRSNTDFNDCSYGAYSGLIDYNFRIYGSTAPSIENTATLDTIADITSTSTAKLNFTYSYHLDSAKQYLGYYSIYPRFNLYSCAGASSSSCVNPASTGWVDQYHANLNIATGTITGGNLANGYYQVKNFYIIYDSTGDGSVDAVAPQAFLLDSNVFQVNYSGNILPSIIPTIPTEVSSTQPIITCDPNSNVFSLSFCKLATWLFIPDYNSLNQYIDLTNFIRSKAPIGYFSVISTALNNVATSTAPVFVIMNTTSTDPVNTTFFSPIRSGLIWILWLAFGFWVFNRLRHFNFTSP